MNAEIGLPIMSKSDTEKSIAFHAKYASIAYSTRYNFSQETSHVCQKSTMYSHGQPPQNNVGPEIHSKYHIY